MEQKEAEGRGGLEGVGSNQPKPRAGRRQTAQSERGAGARGMAGRRAHAAPLTPPGKTAARICGRCQRKFSRQFATYFERPKSSAGSASPALMSSSRWRGLAGWFSQSRP